MDNVMGVPKLAYVCKTNTTCNLSFGALRCACSVLGFSTSNVTSNYGENYSNPAVGSKLSRKTTNQLIMVMCGLVATCKFQKQALVVEVADLEF